MNNEAQITLLYEDMTDVELKKLLVKTIREREGLHYLVGWLEFVYMDPCLPKQERNIAIRKLKRYEESK